jgi:hypothetical protein
MWYPEWKNVNRSFEICDKYPQLISRDEHVTSKSKFSVLISTYNRWELSKKLVYHYAQSNYVDRVFITWHDPLRNPPDNITSTLFFHNFTQDSVYKYIPSHIQINIDNAILYTLHVIDHGTFVNKDYSIVPFLVDNDFFNQHKHIHVNIVKDSSIKHGEEGTDSNLLGELVFGIHNLSQALHKCTSSGDSSSRGIWFELNEKNSWNKGSVFHARIKLMFSLTSSDTAPSCLLSNGNLNIKENCQSFVTIEVLQIKNFGIVPKEIYVLPSYGYNTLNNRFNPSHLIRTDAVLMIDDDSRVSISDTELAFRIWLSNQDRIVGPYKRHVSPRGGGFADTMRWGYDFFGKNTYPLENKYSADEIFDTVDPRDVSFTEKNIHSYSIILTKFMFFSTDYLWIYTCLTPPIGHKIVDKYRNGEDILFNMVIAAYTRKSPLASSIKVDDFGVFDNGISLTKGHKDVRSEVLTSFYHSVFHDAMPLVPSIANAGVHINT